MKLSVALLIIGSCLVAYSLTLKPYKDEQLFMDRYMAMSAGQSEEYWKLRDELLTPKYELQDYGGSLITMSICGLLITLALHRRLRAPQSRWLLAALALTAPFVTAGAFVFELFQGYWRGEFPHWADSLGIPLMAVPILVGGLLFWAIGHLFFLKGTYYSAPIVLAVSRRANLWLLVVAAVTAVLMIFFAAVGAYWNVVPGMLWLYVYLSMAAGRIAHDTQQGVPGATPPLRGGAA